MGRCECSPLPVSANLRHSGNLRWPGRAGMGVLVWVVLKPAPPGHLKDRAAANLAGIPMPGGSDFRAILEFKPENKGGFHCRRYFLHVLA